MLNNNRNNNRCAKKGRYISSLLSLRSLLTRGAAFALLAGIGSSCSQSMDEEAMTRTGAPMTVTATMQGVGKPAAAVSEVVSGSGTGLPATRTTTTDVATGGSYTAVWQKGDVVSVTFHCYSDAEGTTEIAASQMASGNTQTLTYDGTAWTATPSSLRLPVDVYSVKAVYTYSRGYTAADDTSIDGTTILALINRGTEKIAGQSSVVIPEDITKTGIAIAPAADKWQRQTALVRLTSLAFGQSARVTTDGGESTLVSCPTAQTADPTQPANGVLTATVYLHLPVDEPANLAAVTTVTLDGVSGAIKPAFHTEAGRLYSIYTPLLLGQQGAGDEDGGQVYTTWSGSYSKFYNDGAGATNVLKYQNWIIDLSAESDKTSAVKFIKEKANARTKAVNMTLTGIETLPDEAFVRCSKLASISLPEVTNMGYSAFYECSALTSVDMPVATTIGLNSCFGCGALTNVNLPLVTSVKDNAFTDCGALTNVNLPNAITIGSSVFERCKALTSVSLPIATSLGNCVFNYCIALTNMSLPKATSIGGITFYHCDKLASVDLPVLTTIGQQSFGYCQNLTSISLPLVTSVGFYAFQDCHYLTSISLPKATSFKYRVFDVCYRLTTLKLTVEGAMTLDANIFNGFDDSGNCTLYLNTDKQSGSILPQASGNTWFGQTWKAIQYE